jgi:hypothetical protein
VHENVYFTNCPKPVAAVALGEVTVTDDVEGACASMSHAFTAFELTVMEAAVPSVSQPEPSMLVFAWTVQVLYVPVTVPNTHTIRAVVAPATGVEPVSAVAFVIAMVGTSSR